MYEFTRSYSVVLFVTTFITFLLNLVAIAVDEWTIIDDEKRGLWRNSKIQFSPEFYGLEVARGVAIIALLLSFLNCVFAVLNGLRHVKYEKYKKYTYSNAFILCNIITVIFNFLTAIIFTTFVDGKSHILVSLYLFWITFGISTAQLILAAVVKFSLKPGSTQVGVQVLNGSYAADSLGKVNPATTIELETSDQEIQMQVTDVDANTGAEKVKIQNIEKMGDLGTQNSKSSAHFTSLPSDSEQGGVVVKTTIQNQSQVLATTQTQKLTTVNANDENQDRGNWDNQFEYLLSMIGYAVGLGNVWRFPYLCYENGGGAFIIPYVIMLLVAGIPIFFMEVSIAQFSSYGPIKLWNICPAFRGIGMMMVTYSAFVALYYNTIIAYSIFYFFATLGDPVPWSSCDGYMYDLSNSTCSTGVENFTEKVFSPADIYFKDHMQQYVPMDSEFAWELVWQIIVCLFVAWIIVFFVIIRGIKSSGKVAMFAALFPYVVLIALFIRGVTLPGASDGISFYIGADSDFSKLSDMNVWRKAATQIFFSLSAGWGGLHALSSYNTFNNNVVRDTFVVCIVNCCTSIFAGFAIFSILGNMAFNLDTTVQEVVNNGFGLAFIAYPDALSKIAGGVVWCAVFFLMLFTLGLDSEMTTMETVITGLVDVFPNYLKPRRAKLIASLSLGLFILGLVTCTRTGQNWIDVFDTNTGSWGLLLTTLLEILVVGTWYGGGIPALLGFRNGEERLIEDIEIMIGKKSKWFWLPWRCLWYFITPALMIGLLIASLVIQEEVDEETKKLVGKTTFAVAAGWLVLLSGLIYVPVMFFYSLYKSNWNLSYIMQPSKKWGPYLNKHRIGTRYKQINRATGELIEHAEEQSETNVHLEKAETEMGVDNRSFS